MTERKNRGFVGFLIVGLVSLAGWCFNPLLPSSAATLAVSFWGAAVNAAGVALALYCLRRAD